MNTYKIQLTISRDMKAQIEALALEEYGIKGFNNAVSFVLNNFVKGRIGMNFTEKNSPGLVLNDNQRSYCQHLDDIARKTELDYKSGKIKAYYQAEDLVKALNENE